MSERIIPHRIAQLNGRWFVQHPYADSWGWNHQLEAFLPTEPNHQTSLVLSFDTEREAIEYAAEHLPFKEQTGGYCPANWGVAKGAQ
jgi:hypothetical protein